MNYSSLSKDVVSFIKNVTNQPSNDIPISLHEPYFKDTNAGIYLKECIDSGWVSTAGKWVNEFENKICSFTGAKHAVAVTNGTVALRLALHLIGLRNNEEVIIPPLSFIATANAISHLGGIPHFVDIESQTLGISPSKLSQRLEECADYRNGELINKFTNRKIVAIVAVHVFGHPANCPEILEISEKWNLPLIEDAAEALGSWRIHKNNKIHCGLFGQMGILSFNGNKIISTGGGGALITNNQKLADLARHLSTTAKKNHQWEIEHDEIGWNDRLPSINAALGVAQMEVIKERLEKKNKLASRYIEHLKNNEYLKLITSPKNCTSNYWLNNIRLISQNTEELLLQRASILKACHENNIFIRPIWRLLNKQKFYQSCPKGNLQNAEFEEFRIISLPSSPQLIK